MKTNTVVASQVDSRFHRRRHFPSSLLPTWTNLFFIMLNGILLILMCLLFFHMQNKMTFHDSEITNLQLHQADFNKHYVMEKQPNLMVWYDWMRKLDPMKRKSRQIGVESADSCSKQPKGYAQFEVDSGFKGAGYNWIYNIQLKIDRRQRQIPWKCICCRDNEFMVQPHSEKPGNIIFRESGAYVIILQIAVNDAEALNIVIQRNDSPLTRCTEYGRQKQYMACTLTKIQTIQTNDSLNVVSEFSDMKILIRSLVTSLQIYKLQ